MSYATLLKIQGRNWKSFNLISLSGVYQPKKEIEKSKLPIAIKKYLDEHKQVNTVYLHLDKDKTGRLATLIFKTKLPVNIKVIDRPVPFGKDVNDYLLSLRTQNTVNNYKKRSDYRER